MASTAVGSNLNHGAQIVGTSAVQLLAWGSHLPAHSYHPTQG